MKFYKIAITFYILFFYISTIIAAKSFWDDNGKEEYFMESDYEINQSWPSSKNIFDDNPFENEFFGFKNEYSFSTLGFDDPNDDVPEPGTETPLQDDFIVISIGIVVYSFMKYRKLWMASKN